MNFDSAGTIQTEVNQMLLAQQVVMRNRAMINALFNGDTPWTPQEAQQQNIQTNINWLEATRIAHNARNQLDNAFFRADRFFTVRLDQGPPAFRCQWGESITKAINKELRRSRRYKAARQAAHAQVVLHGQGPTIWRNRRSPVPEPVGVDDILVPAGTTTDMENLDRWACYRELTWSQLYEASRGPTVDPGWNREYIDEILENLYRSPLQSVYQGNRWRFPEKIQEDIKSNATVIAASALPKILCWDFFYRDEDSEKWNRRMILDYANFAYPNKAKDGSVAMRQPATKFREDPKFLYKKDGYAKDWCEIVHWYVGNCSNVAPFRYHSVRSIGYLLYGVCLIQNKVRCRFTDHMMQQLLTLFRNVNDDDREKLGLVDLQNFGVIPTGVTMVTGQERHEVDENFILMGLNQGRQLMAESSASFLPDLVGAGERPQMTATETLVRQNSSVSLTSAVLTQLAEQSESDFCEITRRFFDQTNPAPECKRFREAIQRDGVPLGVLDIDAVEILPEKSIGGGSKAAEIASTEAMLEIAGQLGPDAQRLILRKRMLALSDDPSEAMAMVPEVPKPAPDDVQYAQMAFTVLIEGAPFVVRDGVNKAAYASTLISMVQQSLPQVAQLVQSPATIGVAIVKVAGLVAVLGHAEQVVQAIAQSGRSGEQIAKGLQQGLEQELQALQQIGKQAQELEQQQQPAGGASPESQAKIQERLMLADTNAKIMADAAERKQFHKDIAFQSENVRRNAQTAADIERQKALTAAKTAGTVIDAHAQAAVKMMQTKLEHETAKE